MMVGIVRIEMDKNQSNGLLFSFPNSKKRETRYFDRFVINRAITVFLTIYHILSFRSEWIFDGTITQITQHAEVIDPMPTSALFSTASKALTSVYGCGSL